MALPTLNDAKAVLRVQTKAEDALIGQFLTRAQAIVETYIGVPIIAVADTLTDWTTDAVRAYGHVTRLYLPRYPVATTPAPVLTDVDGNVILASTYVVDPRSGAIRATAGNAFDNGPFTIVATVGLSAHPNYTTTIESVVAQAILDLVADLYFRRNPNASSESDGGGFVVMYSPDMIPKRVQMALAPLRISVVG